MVQSKGAGCLVAWREQGGGRWPVQASRACQLVSADGRMERMPSSLTTQELYSAVVVAFLWILLRDARPSEFRSCSTNTVQFHLIASYVNLQDYWWLLGYMSYC